MIEAKFFTVGTYLYKYNLTVLFVSPSKIAHEKLYIYCPPLLLNEIYAHVETAAEELNAMLAEDDMRDALLYVLVCLFIIYEFIYIQ